MRKLLLLLIPVLLTVSLSGCSGTEEVVSTTAPASGTHTATASSTPSTTATAPVSGTATPTATATAVVSPTPSPTVPPNWDIYTDSQLGFSFAHPAELTAQDGGLSTSSGWSERVIVFRSLDDPSVPGFALALTLNNEGLTLSEWAAAHTACLADSIAPREVSGEPALSCTALPEQIPEATVLFEYKGTVFGFSSLMPESDFQHVIDSFEFGHE